MADPIAPATSASARSTRGSRGRVRRPTARHRPVERRRHRPEHGDGRGLERRDPRVAPRRIIRCCRQWSTRAASSARPPRSTGHRDCRHRGDQQASLIGQGCVHPGQAKITSAPAGCSTWWSVPSGRPSTRPAPPVRSRSSRGDGVAPPRGASRRSCVGRHERRVAARRPRLIETSAESEEMAARCDTSEGVVYVPALLGLGTPYWDYGARGTLLGITRGTERPPHRARRARRVAQRGADLVDAAEADGGPRTRGPAHRRRHGRQPPLRPGAGNSTQSRSKCRRTRSHHVGRGVPGGPRDGHVASDDDVAATWHPTRVVEPGTVVDRDRWRDACARARSWFPELSSLEF